MLAFYIFSLVESNDRIHFHWAWSLIPEYIEGLRVTNEDIKRQFYLDLFAGQFLTHTHIKLESSIDDLRSKPSLNLREIRAQKVIRNDGLTKDRLFDALQQITYTYGYVMSLFEKYRLYHSRFDPSSYI